MPVRTIPTATTPTTCATPWPTSRAPTCCPTSGWTTSRWCRRGMSRWNGNTDDDRARGPNDRRPVAARTRGRGDGDAEDRPLQPGESRRRGLAEFPGAVPAQRPAAQPAALREVVPGRHADVRAGVGTRRVRLRRDADQRCEPAGMQGADARHAAEEAG